MHIAVRIRRGFAEDLRNGAKMTLDMCGDPLVGKDLRGLFHRPQIQRLR